jgi:hypothetical protein
VEGEVTSRVSRRRLVRRLGVGTAVAWFTPVVTSLGSVAEASCCQCVEGGTCDCEWTCGGELVKCGEGCGPLGVAYCSFDVDHNCFCWEDSFCSELTDCVQNLDCPPGYACIPDTCCGDSPKCLPACGMGPRTRRRHGKLASGRIR